MVLKCSVELISMGLAISVYGWLKMKAKWGRKVGEEGRRPVCVCKRLRGDPGGFRPFIVQGTKRYAGVELAPPFQGLLAKAATSLPKGPSQ